MKKHTTKKKTRWRIRIRIRRRGRRKTTSHNRHSHMHRRWSHAKRPSAALAASVNRLERRTDHRYKKCKTTIPTEKDKYYYDYMRLKKHCTHSHALVTAWQSTFSTQIIDDIYRCTRDCPSDDRLTYHTTQTPHDTVWQPLSRSFVGTGGDNLCGRLSPVRGFRDHRDYRWYGDTAVKLQCYNNNT